MKHVSSSKCLLEIHLVVEEHYLNLCLLLTSHLTWAPGTVAQIVKNSHGELFPRHQSSVERKLGSASSQSAGSECQIPSLVLNHAYIEGLLQKKACVILSIGLEVVLQVFLGFSVLTLLSRFSRFYSSNLTEIIRVRHERNNTVVCRISCQNTCCLLVSRIRICCILNSVDSAKMCSLAFLFNDFLFYF